MAVDFDNLDADVKISNGWIIMSHVRVHGDSIYALRDIFGEVNREIFGVVLLATTFQALTVALPENVWRPKGLCR
jgi:hypothetical protein